MAYHKFKNSEGEEYGSFEVFYHGGDDTAFVLDPSDKDAEPAPAGWYWWPSFIGCLPDGDPNGPFDSEEEAIKNAQTPLS